MGDQWLSSMEGGAGGGGGRRRLNGVVMLFGPGSRRIASCSMLGALRSTKDGS
jgi:hypothetical protein